MGQYQTLIIDGTSYMNVFTVPFQSEGPHRMYAVTTKPMTIIKLNNPTGADLVRWELWASTSGPPTLRLVACGQDVEIDNLWAFEFVAQFVGCDFPTGTNFITLRLAGRNTSANIFNMAFNANVSPNPFFMTIEDRGVDPGQFGAIGGPAGTVLVTKTYSATWSRSYDSADDPIANPDDDNNAYQGNFDGLGGRAAYGNERSLVGFDGALMRTDLLGKTILTAKLYMYCFVSEDAIGSLLYNTHQSTSPPATYDLATIDSEDHVYENSVSVGGWNVFNALDTESSQTLIGRIVNGNREGISLSPTILGFNATGYRAAADVNKPYIIVQYYQ